MTIALASKPGISGATVFNIPKDWDATWFRNFINNMLKGADVRNAIGANGIGWDRCCDHWRALKLVADYICVRRYR